MSAAFLSMTEIGKLLGVSGQQVGKWLKQVGLRTNGNKPSPRAFKEGYVEQRGSTQPGTYFWIWNGEKTLHALQNAGFTKQIDTVAEPPHVPEAG